MEVASAAEMAAGPEVAMAAGPVAETAAVLVAETAAAQEVGMAAGPVVGTVAALAAGTVAALAGEMVVAGWMAAGWGESGRWACGCGVVAAEVANAWEAVRTPGLQRTQHNTRMSASPA